MCMCAVTEIVFLTVFSSHIFIDMSSKNQKDKFKNVQDKYQSILSRLLREEDNKYCADCDAKGPRWASWNLGIFLCIRCAGIHRNLGVHISRVKSVNLDSWTEEQIMSVQNGGNTLGRKVYEKHLPQDFRRQQTDSSSMEHFIRAKYDKKKYMDKDFVRPTPKRIDDREFEAVEKKERKSAVRSKQQTLVALAKSRENVPRPHPAGLHPSGAASLNAAHLYHSTPNLTAVVADQAPTTLPATVTPVKTVASANDLLGLCTPPASNVNDLLGLDTPTSSEIPVAASNGTTEGSIATSLFGEDAETNSEMGSGGKKTKESIMALFGSSSSGQTQQPAFNVPGGVYISTQQQQTLVANGYPTNSTMPGYQVTQPSQPNGMQGYNQSMMGQQGIVGQQGMVGQPGIVGQQGMMGMQGMYVTPAVGQQSAYLQQIQQQMSSMRVGGSNPPQGQMQQPNWQPSNGGIPQQQPIPTAMAGAGTMGGWGGPASSGHTLSNQLWK